MDKEAFKRHATQWRNNFYTGQRMWSVAHFTVVFGAIVCSTVVGAIQLKSPPPPDPVSMAAESRTQSASASPAGAANAAPYLPMLAVALTSIAVAGGFQRKWQSNRLSRSRVDGLLLDAEADSPNILDLTNQLKDIIAKHDNEILAEAPRDTPPTIAKAGNV